MYMNGFPTIAFAILLFSACSEKESKIDLKGNWYANLGREEPFDVADTTYYSDESSKTYCEYYINDSTITYCQGTSMIAYDQKYFVKGDSIFKCLRPKQNCEFIPLYKIESLHSDTLRLTVHRKYYKGPSIFWVRLPKGELGTYDHSWLDTAKYDSLIGKVYFDFLRRKAIFGSEESK